MRESMTNPPHDARILIVDDDPGILRAVSRILGRRHHVVAVASGEAAVEEARKLKPDLAIVDIRLPAMNGFEVTRRLEGGPARYRRHPDDRRPGRAR